MDAPTNTDDIAPKMGKKVRLQLQMMDAGVDAGTALCITNAGKVQASKSARTKLRDKWKKWSLSRPPLVKSAYTQVERILSATSRVVPTERMARDGTIVTINETIAPTDATILAAASMVYDRYEPIIAHSQSVSVVLSADIHPVDISCYR